MIIVKDVSNLSYLQLQEMNSKGSNFLVRKGRCYIKLIQVE